jgi:Sec-independent protein translocase protein TatA
MQLFNVGALELVFILLLALIILGPRKAVKSAGDVGRWFKELMQSQFWQDLQTTSKEIKDLPKKLMDEAEIQKTIEELDRSEAALQRGIGRQNLEQSKEHWEDPHHIDPGSSGDEE